MSRTQVHTPASLLTVAQMLAKPSPAESVPTTRDIAAGWERQATHPNAIEAIFGVVLTPEEYTDALARNEQAQAKRKQVLSTPRPAAV